jgi:hypothetical protein
MASLAQTEQDSHDFGWRCADAPLGALRLATKTSSVATRLPSGLLRHSPLRQMAKRRGYRELARVVIPGAGHSPFARKVMKYF